MDEQWLAKKLATKRFPLDKIDNIPLELRQLKRWATYAGQIGIKAPEQVSGQAARSDDPATWTTFAEACQRRFIGLMAATPKPDGIIFIDLDKCCDPDTGVMANLASNILNLFTGAYIERSPSGRGFHVICRGKKPCQQCKWTKPTPDVKCIEIYDHTRFLTVTGDLVGEPVHELLDMTDALAKLKNLLDELCMPAAWVASQPRTGMGVVEDKAVLAKLPGTLRTLYYQGARPEADRSKADWRLLAGLCQVTSDDEQVERLAWGSKLAREKWHEHRSGETFLAYLIQRLRKV